MIDEIEKKDFTLKLKKDFIDSNFYNNWLVFYNKRIEINNSLNDSLEKIWLETKTFDFKINTWKTWIIVVFNDEKNDNIKSNEQVKVLKINSDIDKRILQKAIQRNNFYRFDNLKKYLWKLASIDDFITSDNYLWWIEVNLYSSQEVLNNLSNENILVSVSSLLNVLELEIKNKEVKYKWTTNFSHDTIKNLFKEKDIKANWKEISKNDKWFVFEKILWTSEEESFVKLFETEIDKLEKKYEEVYLIRNERVVAIYSFDNWERFEPDFILYLKEKNSNNPLNYQVFIEPKWWWSYDEDNRFEKSKEWWKQDFLKQIENKAEILEINFWNYKLIWLPFYNNNIEYEFKESFENKFNK
jgi:type III restriction enzyme